MFLKYKIRRYSIYGIVLCLLIWFTSLVCQSWDVPDTPQPNAPPERRATNCDLIHIMSVVVGNNETFGFSTLLKSLLAVRRNPLMLHLLVDQDSELVVSEMLSTWLIPGFFYKFYRVQDYDHYFSEIPADHSRNYGLYKVFGPHILKGVNRVIILDTDLILMDDISPIWKEFSSMQASGKVLGLAENQNEVAGGFNTGLILIDIKLIKDAGIDWMSLCRKAMLDRVKVSTLLTGSDVLNAIIAENPSLVMKLPCEWNVQGRHSLNFKFCPIHTPVSTFRIAHIRYRENLFLVYDCANNSNFDCLLANFLARTVGMNGYDFRFPFKVCSNIPSIGTLAKIDAKPRPPRDKCNLWRIDAARVHRVFPFFFSARLTQAQDSGRPAEDVVGIATHLSFNRIGQLELLCQNWKGEGSISAALLLSDADVIPLLGKLASSRLATCQVHIHLVFHSSTLYPTNFIRNIALKFAKNTNVLILDGDFIPSTDFPNTVQLNLLNSKQPVAIIAPAFESFGLEKPPAEGLTKPALLDYLKRSMVIPFHFKFWKKGHAPTNYSRWQNASAAYQIQWAPHYEPYVVVRLTKSAGDINDFEPRFDERYVGFGMNKCSFIMELDAMGYKFMVDPKAFVIHFPHTQSEDNLQFLHSPQKRNCIRSLTEEFIKKLISLYGEKSKKYLSVYPYGRG